MKISHFLLAILCCAGLLYSAGAQGKVNFVQSTLETDFKITHPVISADLLGLDIEQLVVLGEDKNGQRILVLFELLQELNQYSEVSRLPVPEHFIAFDLLKTAKHDKLIFQSQDELTEFVAALNRFETLAKVQSIYLQKTAQFLMKRDFIKDINGDQLDDIIVADFRALHLLLQKPDGGFINQSIEIAPKIEVDQDSSKFTETPLYFADLNQDGKLDLIQAKDAALEVNFQNGHSDFDLNSAAFPLDIDVKSLDWWEIKESDGQVIDQNKLAHRSMHLIQDINNDNLTDLVIRFSQSSGMLDRKNNYEIYFGKLVEGKLSYSAKPDNVITVDGTISKIRFIDLDGDKKAEVVVESLDVGVSQIIGALLTGSIDQDVYVFKMDQNDKYSEQPSVEKEVTLKFSLSSGKSGAPVIKLADFDGDGIKDLMYSDGEKALRVHQGNQSQQVIDGDASKYKINLPQNGNLLDVADLNRDGKEDVIIRYDRQDPLELGKTLLFLFAK